MTEEAMIYYNLALERLKAPLNVDRLDDLKAELLEQVRYMEQNINHV